MSSLVTTTTFDHRQGADLDIKISIYKDLYPSPDTVLQYLIVYIDSLHNLRYAITRHNEGLVSDHTLFQGVQYATLTPFDEYSVMVIKHEGRNEFSIAYYDHAFQLKELLVDRKKM